MNCIVGLLIIAAVALASQEELKKLALVCASMAALVALVTLFGE